MGCKGCSGCGKLFESLNIKDRTNSLSDKINEINNMLDNKEVEEEILLKVLDIEKNVKILRNQLLEKHINKKVGLEVQQGNLEVLEDLMLLIKKFD